MRRVVLLLSAFLLFTTCTTAAFSQSGSSSVRGIVTDPQGNPVAGANVTLSSPEKSFSRSQVTNADGAYSFKPIPPGVYRVEVEMKGFKKAVVSNVQALVDTGLDANVQLEVGTVTETVNVSSAGEAPINTTDATIGIAFDSKRISELPLNAATLSGCFPCNLVSLRADMLTAVELIKLMLPSMESTSMISREA